MRSLTGPTQTARAAVSGSPIVVLKIEFGGVVGTKYYAGRDLASPVTAEGRVIDWGGIYAATALKPEAVVGDVRIRLADADGVLAGYRDDVAFQGLPATVYQLFSGLGADDMVPLASGVIAAPVEWDEATPSLSISITDIPTGHDCVVGHAADRETFTEVSERDEGATLPMVYGRVSRAAGVHVKAGAVARLAAAIADADAMSFIVDDASRFPQGEPITVRIGMEHITGSFTGNTFTVTARGAQVAAGAAGGYTGNPYVIVDTGLSCSDGQYVGNFIRMWVPYAGGTRAGLGRYGGGGWQYRRITRCEAPGVLEFYPAFSPGADSQEHAVDIYLQSGAVWKPTAGTPFAIVTRPGSHEAGEDVRRVLTGYVYIVNDMPSVAVRRVECFGIRRIKLARLQTRRGLFAGFSGGMFVDDPQIMAGLFGAPDEAEDVNATTAGWVTLAGTIYSVDTNDTTTFPGLGRAVTTVTLWLNPSEMPGYEFTSDEIRVDLEGAETDGDGTGTLIENPAEVIEDVLVRFGGLGGGDLDSASFADCAGRMAGLRFGFSLTDRRRLLELVQDLAFQCRTTLLWEAGEAKLKWLTAGAPSPVATIGDDDRAIDSLRVAKTDRDDLYTEVLARWTEGGEERELSVANDVAESVHGRRTLSAELWAHPGRDGAEAVARFWLERLKDVWEVVHLSTFLNTLELEREDAVTLSLPGYYPSGTRAVVEAVEHRPGSGAAGQIDRIHYRLRVPYFAGCETVCEAYCETAGCESATELAACTDTCETSCQGLCELGCQNAFELGCGGACESTCTFGCQQSCTGINMPGCSTVETGSPPAGACESACQSYCQYQSTAACDMETCMVTCVAGCESACQISCTSDCELAGCESAGCTTYCTVSGCESACQTGVQHCYEDSCRVDSCQLGCTVALTISCSGDCQTICVMSCTLDCQLGCTSSCEAAGCTVCCEQSCTSGCEDGCQTSCEVGCESLGCQSVNCETTCEAGCETGCETSCETGCEVGCETGCEISCEHACTLICEHGCQNQGEGCYMLCQAVGIMS